MNVVADTKQSYRVTIRIITNTQFIILLLSFCSCFYVKGIQGFTASFTTKPIIAAIPSSSYRHCHCSLHQRKVLTLLTLTTSNKSTLTSTTAIAASNYEPNTINKMCSPDQDQKHQSTTAGQVTKEAAAATTNSNDSNNIIDGKAIAATIRQELKVEVEEMVANDANRVPGLAVVLVGSRRDSQTYVNMKKKACAQVGIASFGYDFDESVTEQVLLDTVEKLNKDDKVHGILVQLPLPDHINEATVLQAINPEKDVDGLHSVNVAKLAMYGTNRSNKKDGKSLANIPFSVPCTPLGCMELLLRSGVDLTGKHAVVIGRSNLVGLPVSFLLLHFNATLTIVHSKTSNIESVVQQADVVVAAVGRALMVKKEWLKEGAVVIDVGINSVDLPPDQIKEGKKPYKLVGDVDYDDVKSKCSLITPVPGGVGPMTIAMLLRNTVNACKRSI